jgi:hypothetical protein
MTPLGKMEYAKTCLAGLNEPGSVYEAHPGSWMHAPKLAFGKVFFKHTT